MWPGEEGLPRRAKNFEWVKAITLGEAALQIGALFGLAVAQPIYSALSRQPEFFLARESQPVDFALFCLILSLVLPGLLVVLLAIFYPLKRGIPTALHLVVCFGLSALWGLQFAKALTANISVTLILATSFGLAVALALALSPLARRFVNLLSPAVVVCPLLFLLSPGIRPIAFQELNAGALMPKVKATAPVVMVIFDEFPTTSLLDGRGRIDGSRYPHFAALAEQANWYPFATSSCDRTGVSVASILSGLPPQPDKNPVLPQYPQNIFTWLGASYELRIMEYFTKLSPRGQTNVVSETLAERLNLMARDTAIFYGHIILPVGLSAKWLPSIENQWKGFGQAQNSRESRHSNFSSFLDSLRPVSGPAVYFAHIFLPHYPYVYLPSGQEYDNSGAAVCDGLIGQSWAGPRQSQLGLQRQLLQVAYLDSLIGTMIAQMKADGLWDRSLVVLAADHGASFRVGPHRKTTAENVADQMFVPLFIKLPGQTEGLISLANATTLDILPTIADALGEKLPWEVAGRSLLDLPSKPEGSKSFLAILHWEKPNQIEIPDWLEQFSRAAVYVHQQFPRPGIAGLYQSGPRLDLYGRPLAELTVGQPLPFTVELNLAALLRDVDPQSSFLPVRLTGHVLGFRSNAMVPLAFVMHDQVVAMSDLRPNGSFETLVDPKFLRKGDNSVSLYLVEGDTLRPIPDRTPPEYQITADQVRAGDGQVYPLSVAPESLIDQWIIDEQRVTLRGWVKSDRVPAKRLLVFVGDKAVSDFPLEGTGVVGFSEELPRDLVGSELPNLVVLFADGTACSLKRRESYQLHQEAVEPS